MFTIPNKVECLAPLLVTAGSIASVTGNMLYAHVIIDSWVISTECPDTLYLLIEPSGAITPHRPGDEISHYPFDPDPQLLVGRFAKGIEFVAGDARRDARNMYLFTLPLEEDPRRLYWVALGEPPSLPHHGELYVCISREGFVTLHDRAPGANILPDETKDQWDNLAHMDSELGLDNICPRCGNLRGPEGECCCEEGE